MMYFLLDAPGIATCVVFHNLPSDISFEFTNDPSISYGLNLLVLFKLSSGKLSGATVSIKLISYKF